MARKHEILHLLGLAFTKAMSLPWADNPDHAVAEVEDLVKRAYSSIADYETDNRAAKTLVLAFLQKCLENLPRLRADMLQDIGFAATAGVIAGYLDAAYWIFLELC